MKKKSGDAISEGIGEDIREIRDEMPADINGSENAVLPDRDGGVFSLVELFGDAISHKRSDACITEDEENPGDLSPDESVSGANARREDVFEELDSTDEDDTGGYTQQEDEYGGFIPANTTSSGNNTLKESAGENALFQKDAAGGVISQDAAVNEDIVIPSKNNRDNAKRSGVRRAVAVLHFILKWLKRLIVLSFILAVAAAIYYYYRIYLPGETGNKEYMLVEAEYRDLYTAVSATGKIAATDEVALYLETPQKVEKVHVKEGDSVYAGQVLITYDIASELKNLDQKRQIALLNQLNAELGAQRIALPAAGNELLTYTADVNSARKSIQDSENSIESINIRINQQRIRVADAENLVNKNSSLYEQGFLTKEEYDLSVSSLSSANESLNDLSLSLNSEQQNLEYRRVQLANAEQKLANVKNKLGDEASRLMYEQQLNIAELSRIEIEQIDDEIKNYTEYTLSPLTGSVASINAADGAIASRNNPVMTISDLSALIVNADASQYDAPKLAIGQRADIFAVGLPDKPYSGVVAKIASASVEKESGSEKEVIVPVEIAIDDIDGLLKLGYNVDIDIITEERANRLCVPSQVVFNDGEGSYVYLLAVLDDAGSDAEPSEAESPEDEPSEDGSGIGGYIVSGFASIDSVGGAVEYFKTLFDLALEKLDGLFPRRVSTTPVPVRHSIETGFNGDNGIEIISGLAPGDSVVLNP